MDELLLTLGNDETPGTRTEAEADATSVGGTVTGGIDDLGVYSVGWIAPQDLAARKAQLEALPKVASVTYRDIEAAEQSTLPPGDWNDDGQEVTWPFTQIHAQEAWGLQSGGFAKVGIVDTGLVQPNHEDLTVATSLGGAKGVQWHATQVAGLACGRANGIGLVGVAWGCPLVTAGLKDGSDEAVLVAATAVALQPGVKVINMSLKLGMAARCASPTEHAQRMAYEESHVIWFRRLFTHGAGKEIVWTMAAGNHCENGVPAAWGRTGALNVLVVGATNSDGSLPRFSAFGSGVTVAAPGGVDVEPPRNGTVGLWSTWRYGELIPGKPECAPCAIRAESPLPGA